MWRRRRSPMEGSSSTHGSFLQVLHFNGCVPPIFDWEYSAVFHFLQLTWTWSSDVLVWLLFGFQTKNILWHGEWPAYTPSKAQRPFPNSPRLQHPHNFLSPIQFVGHVWWSCTQSIEEWTWMLDTCEGNSTKVSRSGRYQEWKNLKIQMLGHMTKLWGLTVMT